MKLSLVLCFFTLIIAAVFAAPDCTGRQKRSATDKTEATSEVSTTENHASKAKRALPTGKTTPPKASKTTPDSHKKPSGDTTRKPSGDKSKDKTPPTKGNSQPTKSGQKTTSKGKNNKPVKESKFVQFSSG